MDENDLHVSPSQEPPKIPIDDSGLVELAQKRKDAALKKKTTFDKIYKVVKIAGLIFVLTFAAALTYKNINKTAPSNFNVNNTTPTPTKAEENPNDVSSWNLYKSEKNKVFVKHPKDAVALESTNAALRLDVVYDKNNSAPTSGNETDLVEGFIFRVTPLDVGIRNIDSISQIKMESFKVKCPATAVFSQVRHNLVDSIDSRNFEIKNCNGDYIINYIPRFGIYYEIAQFYKGDFGYKQKYRATLEEMLRAFKFFPEATAPVGPFKTFVDEKNKILFIHANLDETCCDLPKPPITELITIINLGIKETYKDKDNFDGIGLFMKDLSYYDGGLDRYVEDQKRLLVEDYKVITGVEPVTTVSEVQVGKYRAFRLKGYSWRGNELVYLEVPGSYSSRMLIFSIRNISGESFETHVQQILSSLETY